MIYAVFTEDGLPAGFYDDAVHGVREIDGEVNPDSLIPVNAIEIADTQRDEFLAHQGQRRWQNGTVVEYEPPSAAPTVSEYEGAIQSLVDQTARERQFRDGVTMASYVASTNEQWASEAQAFVAWRDGVWAFAYSELAKVQAGEREQPSVADFLTEIEPIVWPDA